MTKAAPKPALAGTGKRTPRCHAHRRSLATVRTRRIPIRAANRMAAR